MGEDEFPDGFEWDEDEGRPVFRMTPASVWGDHRDKIPPPCWVCAHPHWLDRAHFVAVGLLCNEHRRLGIELGQKWADELEGKDLAPS